MKSSRLSTLDVDQPLRCFRVEVEVEAVTALPVHTKADTALPVHITLPSDPEAVEAVEEALL